MGGQFGITTEDRGNPCTGQVLLVYSGPYMELCEATGYLRAGAKQITLTTIYGDNKIIVRFPYGTTGIRTNANFADIDKAISDRMHRHYGMYSDGNRGR